MASVLLFGTAADVWVKRQVLSTPKWVAASDKILADPKVQAALATYIVDEIYSSVDVRAVLADELPDSLKGLAAPLAAGLEAPASTAVERILSTDRVKKVWHTVNEKAHQALVNVLEDKTRIGSTKDGNVTLDIGEIIRIVGTDLGIPSSVMDKIPASVGQITIFESSSLASIQTAVKIVNILGPILFVLIVVMYLLAVWLARGRRRLTLRNVGWSVIVVGLILTTMRRISGNYVASMITDPQYSLAGKFIFGVLSELLFNTAWLLITWGAVIVLGMVLIGPSRIATWARRSLAPLFNADQIVFWAGAFVLYVLVLLVVPSPAFRTQWSLIALTVIVGFGLDVLRRRSLREFPDAHIDVDSSRLRNSASTAWAGMASRLKHDDSGSQVDQLKQLSELHASGALSDGEFAAAKAKLLGAGSV
ncbi:unannotated protein [freshwater metagenome]|uniref:Unannotated protein n=1 Tax=freshwater metagenome TaxID=449393 RepID=A0A6J5ZW58_9ZZZZ